MGLLRDTPKTLSFLPGLIIIPVSVRAKGNSCISSTKLSVKCGDIKGETTAENVYALRKSLVSIVGFFPNHRLPRTLNEDSFQIPDDYIELGSDACDLITCLRGN